LLRGKKHMAWAESYTVPVYEAVLCGLTLENAKRQEVREEDVQYVSGVTGYLAKLQDALRTLSESDLSKISRRDIAFIFNGVTLLVAITILAEETVRQRLSNTGDAYRSVLQAVADGLQSNESRLEEIAEAWQMALDETEMAEINKAISEAKAERGMDDVPDWRDVLASTHD
jgi:DNA mismatch repair ATPase MutS